MATSYEKYENWLSRRKGKQGGDLYKLDTKNKTPEENIKDIIQGLYLKKPFHNDTSPTSRCNPMEKLGLRNLKNSSDSRRLAYLNAIVTLLCKEDRSNLGFTADELMTCIRVSLVDESMVIRASALRVLRYLIKTESDVATFNNLKLPYLVIRSIDLMLRNEEERAQALRVVRRVVAVVGAGGVLRRHRAAVVEPGLLRCLSAVARAQANADGAPDRLSRPAIATLAEICVLNPDMFISCGGVGAVTRQLAECATPRMAEALCGVLLHALNDPTSRRAARIDLMCLSSPYCDFHFRPAGTESSRDEREMRFTCSRLALLCVLRSWPGLLHFCHPYSSGGLRALVAALYLPRLEVRKAILDLLYELVGLPQPEWTDEISVALAAVDPSDFQDSWRLNEGFVAAEGTSILPHLGATGPDIIEIHLALLLQCFLEAGLLDGLAEVIVTSDTFISVRATVLLGQLLHLIHLYLPPQICSITPALPTLMSQASAGKPQALAAVAALRRLHSMIEARPASSSLFLDHIIQYCSGAFKEKVEDCSKSRKEKDNASMVKPKADLSLHKENSIEFLNDSDNENEPKRHSVGSRAEVANRNVSALVKSKSVSSRTSAAVSKVTKSAKFFNLFERDGDSLIRCTLVMQNEDGNTWNWEIIRTILKENDSSLLNLNDSCHKAWVARIINYLKPSANKYSHTDLSSTAHGHSATRAGCQLIRHLLRHNDIDSQRLLEDLFSDVSHQIHAIETGLKAHECLFSPQHMCNTMCQMYFLFIGQLCHSHNGLRLFKQTGLYENLLDLSTKTHHSCYVKLVISSLDYTLDSYPRDIISKTLTCSIQASRLYATQFLNVLLRASRKSRELVRRKAKLKKNVMQEHLKSSQRDDVDVNNGVDMDTWILQMLVGQLKDESKVVVKTALSILEEAYSVPSYVEKLITMKDALCQNCRLDKSAEPSSIDFSTSSDRGYLLWLGLEVAIALQSSDAKSIGFLKKHLDFWTKSYNYRYARLVEAGAHDALALSESGGARGAARQRRSARPPPHLYAALATRPRGPHHPSYRARALLAGVLPDHYKILQRKKCGTEQEVADLKATLWAVGNTAITPQGLQQLMSLSNGYLEDSVLVHIVRLAKFNPVYSVRATAFYVLGLIGSTYDGANLLADLGWLCVRHTRHDQFPLIPEETYSSFEQGSNVHYYVTSPDYRYNAYEAEMSEHSDHTDQSVVESFSENLKHLGKAGSISENSEIRDQDVVDYKVFGVKEPDKRKSHTLPSQSCSSSHDRPTLSESRTVDIIRDCSSYERSGPHRLPMVENRLIGRMNSLEHAHEGRVRNTSESSTSGVSSCDSFLGKYAIPDRVLTLSPIPSSSSLYGMKSTNSSHRPRISEMQRRTSTSSFTGQEVASSPPSQMDMTGYATLKSLNRRPHVSESAATGSTELDDLSWLLSDSNRRTKAFSSLRDRAKTTKERMTKLSLLEYDWKPLPLGESGRQSPPPAARVPRRATNTSVLQHSTQYVPHTQSAAYMGICLPRDLMELFPRDEERIDEEIDKSENTKRGRLPSFLADTSSASTENKSRATPDSQKLTSHRGLDNIATIGVRSHFPTTITAHPSTASTSTTTVQVHKSNEKPDANKDTESTTGITKDKIKMANKEDVIKGESAKNYEAKSDSKTAISENVIDSLDISSHAVAEDDENIAINALAEISEALTSVGSAVGGSKWRHIAADCICCVRTRPPSSRMDGSGYSIDARSPTSENPSADRTSNPHAELLHQVRFMSNPIHLRQTRSVLISMKQRHPEVFRSPCVYSDVSALLARDTYMLCARRFIQELFLDTSFECFANEPAAVLSRHGAVASPSTVAPDLRE